MSEQRGTKRGRTRAEQAPSGVEAGSATATNSRRDSLRTRTLLRTPTEAVETDAVLALFSVAAVRNAETSSMDESEHEEHEGMDGGSQHDEAEDIEEIDTPDGADAGAAILEHQDEVNNVPQGALDNGAEVDVYEAGVNLSRGARMALGYARSFLEGERFGQVLGELPELSDVITDYRDVFLEHPSASRAVMNRILDDLETRFPHLWQRDEEQAAGDDNGDIAPEPMDIEQHPADGEVAVAAMQPGSVNLPEGESYASASEINIPQPDFDSTYSYVQDDLFQDRRVEGSIDEGIWRMEPAIARAAQPPFEREEEDAELEGGGDRSGKKWIKRETLIIAKNYIKFGGSTEWVQAAVRDLKGTRTEEGILGLRGETSWDVTQRKI